MSTTAHSSAIRQAGREVLSLALMDARNQTLRLLTAFESAGDTVDLAPALLLAGRSGWFAEAWIGRNPQRSLGTACPPRPVRLASIEPMADLWWAPELGGGGAGVAGPGAALTREWLRDTLESTLELLERTPETPQALYFYRLALHHEDLAVERLQVLAQSQGVTLGVEPPAVLASRQPLVVPAVRWQLGSADDGSFVFDNEKWAHPVAVPEFEIDAQPVSWAQFAEFVADGGYERESLWQPEGWRWREAAAPGGRQAPRGVEAIGGRSGAVVQQRFGRAVRLASGHAAVHLSGWEADAWCRWAGRRLPDEAEWEVAAHRAAALGFRWGEVREWTASRFVPYPGFAPDPWAECSLPHFDRCRVLRGACWLTPGRLRHPKFRGFARPGDDSGFTGFRSCAR